MSDCAECQGVTDFVQKFNRTTDAGMTPLQATAELTYRCNFDCVHCYNVKHWVGGELSLEEWEDVFDQLAAAGCMILTLTGGEPLVHPRFFEIAEAARKRRFALKLLTNASLITEEKADRIAALQPLQVDVSFYGADREVWATVVRRDANGLYDRTYDGVRRLVARGIKVVAKVPLLRENFEDRWNMERLAKELGCLIRANAEITPKDDGDRSPQEHALTNEQLAEWLRDNWRPREPRTFREDSKLCQPGMKAVAIGPFGDVFPCIQIKKSMGNLRRHRFREIWNDSPGLAEVRSLRARDFETCTSCSSFGNCKPCLGVSMLETGALTGPNSEACRREETRARIAAALPILP